MNSLGYVCNSEEIRIHYILISSAQIGEVGDCLGVSLFHMWNDVRIKGKLLISDLR